MKRLIIHLSTVTVVVLAIGGLLVVQRAAKARKGIARIVMQSRADAENACWKKDAKGDWVFSNADYYSVLRQIDASSCSKDFQAAWTKYVEAVRVRSETTPTEKIGIQPGLASTYGAKMHPQAVPDAWGRFETAAHQAGVVE